MAWWSLDVPHDATDDELTYIADLIVNGYTSGELVREEASTEAQLLKRIKEIKSKSSDGSASCQEMKEFKAKWDGKKPHGNSNEFKLYVSDCNAATIAQAKHFGCEPLI